MNRVILLVIMIICLSGPAVTAAGQGSLPDLFAKVNPAVVEIHSVSLEEIAIASKQTTTIAQQSEGSGVLIDRKGTILTASHVVQTAEKVVVKLLDGRNFQADIVASANWGDIALLQLEKAPDDLPEPIILADSDKVRIGEQVFVIGSPFGYSHSLTVGHISSRFLAPAMIGTGTMEVFQTDAAMNPGNSGGPLFNMRGEVIGIASQITTTSGGFNGVAFAVTTNQIRQLLNKVSSWSGLEGRLLTGELAKLFNLPQPAGFLVQKVAKNSWAGRIGLRPSSVAAVIDGENLQIGGDILLDIGDLEVSADPDFFKQLTDYLFTEAQAGNTMSIRLLRGGEIMTLVNAPVNDIQ